MSLTRSVARNTITQMIGRIVSIILALLVFVFVARHLGVDGYGSFTTATAFLQFFSTVVDMGLYVYLAKSLGEPGVDESSVVSNVFTLRLISAVAILGIAPLAVLFFPYPTIVKVAVLLLMISSLFTTLTQALAGIFQKTLHTGRFIMGEVTGRIALLLLTLLAIHMNMGLIGIVVTVVVSAFINFILTLWWAQRLIRFRLVFDTVAWKKILSVTWPIALSIMFNVVYFKADTIILSLYYPAHDVGIYGAPYKVFEAFISFPALFAGLLTPILTTAFLTDRARFERILRRGFEALLLAALPIVVITMFAARDVMALVAPGFEASAPVFQILVFGTAAIFLGYLFSNAIVVVNRQRTMLWTYAIVAVSSLALYFGFIPRYSYFGAAIVTVVVESAVALVGGTIVLRASKTSLAIGPVVRIIAAALGMAAVMLFCVSLPWYLNMLVGLAAYAGLVIAFRAVHQSVIEELFSKSSA